MQTPFFKPARAAAFYLAFALAFALALRLTVAFAAASCSPTSLEGEAPLIVASSLKVKRPLQLMLSVTAL